MHFFTSVSGIGMQNMENDFLTIKF